MPDVRVCTRCKIEKPLTEFYVCKTRNNILWARCKLCSNEINKLWRTNNIGRSRSCSKTNYYKRRAVEPHFFLLDNARKRARKNNIPFDLEPDDIVVPDVCPVLGTPLQHNFGNKGHWNNSPSVDRIIPTLGYVKGNVWVISMKANKMKNDASPEELVTFGKWALNNYGSLGDKIK